MSLPRSRYCPRLPASLSTFYGSKSCKAVPIVPPRIAFPVLETSPRVSLNRAQPPVFRFGSNTLWGTLSYIPLLLAYPFFQISEIDLKESTKFSTALSQLPSQAPFLKGFRSLQLNSSGSSAEVYDFCRAL